MKILVAFVSIISFQITSLPALAADGTETSHRYPSELSEEEFSTMMSYRGSYDECLNKEAQANIDKYEDFRKVADVAMESCTKTLSEIETGLTKMNLDPDFIRNFLRKTSQKSAQKLIPDLMRSKAR